jgi:hypothetical protein
VIGQGPGRGQGIPAAFPVEACPRQPDASCSYELDVTIRLEGAPAEVNFTAWVSAWGELEQPTKAELWASVEIEDR